ncbi:DUF2459 domain-containing protein [Ramlibacter rhizophilus]|uniref:DUF2459 domain-containing protein n=1 Tax=Ramlibacter rhizophilus TaxID=1781167 RepID=UPI0014327CD1|nr:DUF2459 domain-containing protein [Ramlibacter rhizophilus]
MSHLPATHTCRAILLAALLASGCASPPEPPPAPERTVFVVRHGWHTGIVFRSQDLPADSPLRTSFPRAHHIEVGWGDRAFYPAREPGLVLGLRALLWPTPGALHVVGLAGPPALAWPDSTVVEVGVTAGGLDRMHERVRGSFARDAGGALEPLGPGLYGDSRFYASRESFHAFKTCNVWTAQVLRAGGLPTVPAAALTSGMLLNQIRPLRLPEAAGQQSPT